MVVVEGVEHLVAAVAGTSQERRCQTCLLSLLPWGEASRPPYGIGGLERGSDLGRSASCAASTPTTWATASIACILAVAAAAATAAAVGIAAGAALLIPTFIVSGGVMDRPTRRYCPPRSNRFMELMASCVACGVSYSM